MMLNQKPLALAAAALSFMPSVLAKDKNLLPGYGVSEYDPRCSYVCRFAMPTALNCPEYADMTAEELAEAYPSAECFGHDDYYLSSMALCLTQHCTDSPLYKVEKFWETDLYYESDESPPKWTWAEATAWLNGTTDFEPFNATAETVFNRTITIDDDTYLGYFNALDGYSQYALWNSRFM